MKIAAVTEDGKKLSSHFGRAPFYRVYEVQAGQIVNEEERPKPHHGQPDAPQAGHADMFAPISDCSVLICGGMGEPAYNRAQAAGLEVVLTGGEIAPAVQSYLGGNAQSDLRRIHRHSHPAQSNHSG